MGNTPFSGVNPEVFYTYLILNAHRGQLGSNFHIWVQNPMGVLTTKFHSYPINISQVIPFLKSIITFSGKRLLTPDGVTGGFSLARGLFLVSVVVSDAAIKSIFPRSLFCVNCLFPV